MNRHCFHLSALTVAWFIFTTAAVGAGTDWSKNSNIGVLLSDDTGMILYSQNGDHAYIPASILKLLTSVAAFDILGEEFHYRTRLAYDPQSKDLYVKGLGDPLLISEVLREISYQIVARFHPDTIRHIFLDQTFFHEKIIIPGKTKTLNPYDAPPDALSANFNTLFFKWHGADGQYHSAEDQTPLLPAFSKKIERTRLKQGRIVLTPAESHLYPGWLIQYFLRQNGVPVRGQVLQTKKFTEDAKTFDFISPYPLKEIVKKLLQFSNNFIANQLFLTMGAAVFETPATLDKGAAAVLGYAASKIDLKNAKIVEGSGLSRENRLSPSQMLKILLAFMPHAELMRHEQNDLYKTGTLTGVRTRAGYLVGKNHKLYPYVIMVNRSYTEYNPILGKLKQLVTQQ